MRLKSWESPRSGPRRNDKSKQASARLRQLKKRNQQLRKRLKANGSSDCDTPKAPGTHPGAFLWPLPRIIGKPNLPVFYFQASHSSSQYELLRFASLPR
jgi:hypothetical protein